MTQGVGLAIAELRNEEIYEALLEDGALAALPARMAEAFGARSTVLQWVHTNGSSSILSHSGYFSDQQLELYAQRYVALDPWIRAAETGHPPNVALNLEDLVPVAKVTQSVFYNEFIRSLGDDTCRGIGMHVRNGSGNGFIALHRGLGQSSFDAAAVEALQHYAKHLTRMLSVRGSLSALSSRAHGLEAALDALGDAMFLLNEDGVIVHANQSAREMLEACSGLSVRGGALRACSPTDDNALRAAIARGRAPSSPEAAAVTIGVGPNTRSAFSLVPVRGINGERQVLLTAKNPYDQPCPKPRLRALYDLSPGEADVALRLADGATPHEIAERRGVSVATVRVQIKNVAQKLGCHRQSDIVARVKDLPSLRSA